MADNPKVAAEKMAAILKQPLAEVTLFGLTAEGDPFVISSADGTLGPDQYDQLATALGSARFHAQVMREYGGHD